MARFTEYPDFINASKARNREVDVRVSIDWFDDGTLETIESADDEFMKLDLDRTLEGDIGTSVMDKGTLILDNSNDDYSPKSIASRFNVEISESTYEFNLIPNRTVVVELSVNGSDYYPYYYGIISNIESNYDNSRVSIDIEDEMIILQNEEARDEFFLEASVKEVIETLLKDSAIDFNTNLVDDIDYIINYNFKDETIFEALRLIAEMSWARFFVTDGELYFIDIQSLDEPNMTLTDTLEDEDFLVNGYSETYGAQDLYNKATVTANPYKRAKRDMIWTGAENEAEVSETYVGSDIDTSDVLQLTYTTDDGTEKNTNNVPIAEGSVAVEFGNTVYTVGSGLSSIDYLTGAITFTNDTTYPLPDPDQQVRVGYTYFLLSLPPAQNGEPYEKEVIAKHEFPSVDISNPNDYVKFEPVTGSKEIIPGSYQDSFSNINYSDDGGSGSVERWTDTITVDPDTTNIRITGNFNHNAYDHRFCFIGCYGGERAEPDSKIELFVNGSLHSTIYQTTKFGHSSFDSKTIGSGITGGDEIQLKATLTRNCDKASAITVTNTSVNISTLTTEQEQGTVGKVDIIPEYINEERTKLIFKNYGDTEVIMYSEYEGQEIDNIYLTGIPFKQNSPIEKVTDNQDAARSFTLNSNEITVDNNLIYDNTRAQKTADFLVNYYATPKSIISVPLRGRPHYELLDKVHVNRDEADIDNDFIINQISDTFTEDGEWNQTLELRQARSSQWQYTDNGGANIIEKIPIEGDSIERPPVVTNLSLSLSTRQAGDSNYPAIQVNFDSNRFTRFHKIYVKRELNPDWELVNTIEEESYVLDSIFDRGDYSVRVVSVGYNGLNSEFVSSPMETISYSGSEIIPNTDITLTELKREVQNGLYLPVIQVSVANYIDDYFDRLNIYAKKETETEWELDGTTTNLTYEILTPELGNYEIKVIPVDKHGNTPDFDSIDALFFTVTGETDLPSQVELESVYWGADYIEFIWKPHPDEDFDEYELRKDEFFGE